MLYQSSSFFTPISFPISSNLRFLFSLSSQYPRGTTLNFEGSQEYSGCKSFRASKRLPLYLVINPDSFATTELVLMLYQSPSFFTPNSFPMSASLCFLFSLSFQYPRGTVLNFVGFQECSG